MNAVARRLLFLLAAAPMVGCGADEEATAPAASSSPSSAEDAPSPSAAAAAEPTPVRIHHDLRAHISRAELRQGRALVVDLGVPGGAKYTLGGWQTRVGEDHLIDGASAALIPGVTGQLLLPVDAPGARKLTLRARAFSDGRLTIYLDGETVAHDRLPTDGGYAEVEVALPADVMTVGEHLLQLRVPAVGNAGEAGRAGIAVDWMRLAPVGDEALTAPPSPDDLLGEEGLRIPAGWSLGHSLDVPPGARLRMSVRGADGARLAVVAHSDGQAPQRLGTVAATPSGAPLDLDLSAFVGRVIRVDLEATGDVVCSEPRVVIPAPAEVARVESRRPRNVLVYLIDTLRADKLHPYAPESRVETPGLDRYVRSAAVFERGHTQENWTKPSVATLLSGLLPWQHRATGSEAVLPRSVTLLSEQLEGEGFYTGAFIANGYVSRTFGFGQGWSTYRNYIRQGMRTQARFVAADVLSWLDERPSEKPFFLYVHTIDPHVPYIPPPELIERYDPGPYDGPVDFRRDRELLEKIKVGSLRLDARDRQRLEALYDGEITYHDTHFASILEGLASRGLAEDTLVVITADHGEEFFDHDSVGHGHSLYEELLHVPLVVRHPGLTDGGMRVPDSVGLVDVFPTVLDALGMEVPEEVQGSSLMPLLRSETPSAPRVAVAGFMQGWRALTVGRWKLIQRGSSTMMLFDLAEDPAEERDLSALRPLALRHLRGLLGLALKGEAGAAHVHEAERAEIDDELDEQLRQLGYVGGSRPADEPIEDETR